MRKNKNKQKKSLLFSTAVVISGCIATAIYVNQSIDTTTNYKLDLSQIEKENGISMSTDPEFSSGAPLVSVTGDEVVNTVPDTAPTEDSLSKEDVPEAEKPETEKPETEKPETEKPEKEKQEVENQVSETEEVTQTSTPSVVNHQELTFSKEDGIEWPLQGDIILNYSMDKTTYFATLNQYKYNPAILIGAVQGDKICSCARGEVVKIAKSAELGTYVVMNLGSGYEAVYGQLSSLQIKEGDIVEKGQIIGDVAKASRYYTLEGDHLYLKLTKDGEPVDPLSFL